MVKILPLGKRFVNGFAEAQKLVSTNIKLGASQAMEEGAVFGIKAFCKGKRLGIDNVNAARIGHWNGILMEA